MEDQPQIIVLAGPTASGLPGAATGLTATPADQEVSVSWGAPPGATDLTGYKVLWRSSSTGTPTSKVVAGTTTSYIVPDLANGTTYQFEVEATDAAGTGPATAWASAKPSAQLPPLPPTRLQATSGATSDTFTPGSLTAGQGVVDLTWSPPAARESRLD